MSTPASPALEENRKYQFSARAFKGHADVVRSVAYLKGGKWVTSGSYDGTIWIWNVENGRREGQSMVHESSADSIAISPDEKKMVSGGSATTLWDLESRAVVWKTKEVNGSVVAFSPDGQLIAVKRGKDEVLLDTESGRPIREPLQVGDGLRCLAFSPDATRLAVGSWDGKVWLFNVATGETVVGPFNAHARTMMAVTSVVFTHDGQQFVTASWDKSVRVWNSANGHKIGEPMLGHKDYIHQIALSGDGRRVASASGDGTVRIWDVGTRRQLGDPLQAHNNLYSVAWSSSGLSIVAGDLNGNIHLWTSPFLDNNITVSSSLFLQIPLPILKNDQAQAPILDTSTPPLPSASRSRTSSVSSSILNLPAGPLPAPPRSPALDNGAAEENDWEYSENESFDSVLDAPRRWYTARSETKKTAQTCGTSRIDFVAANISKRFYVVPNAPPAIIGAPRHPPPLGNKIPSPPAQTSPDTHAVADAPAPRTGALRGLWRQRLNLPQWARRKARKDCDESREGQPVEPSPTPNASANNTETQPTQEAADHAEETKTAPKPRIVRRLFARSKRQPRNTSPGPENIEMHPPPSAPETTETHPRQEARLPKYARVGKVALAEADPRL
ncbi:quinon protein alcohol dehydrogenase-like superfamily [Hygrophoropsis aurantiaca]|uniref:Quinon protein alcohol dehydrogenase-like superfamily n=1 Tax=Hygrophoropsis aurantiaca TaxID=72124 RepID=A0ACB8ACD0_9AGAM|nr:quinon protein alcohol dehydrogenase-like superfamily [Hygrophoropsis aurantiaca]